MFNGFSVHDLRKSLPFRWLAEGRTGWIFSVDSETKGHHLILAYLSKTVYQQLEYTYISNMYPYRGRPEKKISPYKRIIKIAIDVM